MNRWNLVPYLNLGSRIDSVKMNILPRLLCLFHSVPIEKPEQYFLEWDKILSRFIRVGKKPRIKYKTLQLLKEKGGLSLPCLRNTIKQLKYWHQLDGIRNYRLRWKESKMSTGKGLPVNTLVGDPSSTNHLSDPNNPQIIGFLPKVSTEGKH